METAIRQIVSILEKRYPEAILALEYTNPFQLLVAVLLSARCSDARVNAVTRELFTHLATPADFVDADMRDIEDLIRPTGFYRNKAKLLKNCCKELQARFHNRVPESMDDLISLPGIGRKSANMIRGNAFGLPGIAVDTHVQRVVVRLGLTSHTQPDSIEKDLCRMIPENTWTAFSNRTILFGREVCMSRKPRCSVCPLLTLCPYGLRSERTA